MVSILSLWMPILLSAVGVFLVSTIIHMFLGYHSTDFNKLPDEDGVMDELLKFNIPPGEYVIPHAGSMKAYSSPEFVKKLERGMCAFMTVMPKGKQSMGGQLTLWFLYSIVIAILAAYVAGRALEPGAYYLSVFRFVSVVTFIAYAVGTWQNSIWFRRSWMVTAKNTFDGLVYALVSGGIFGWLWPAS